MWIPKIVSDYATAVNNSTAFCQVKETSNKTYTFAMDHKGKLFILGALTVAWWDKDRHIVSDNLLGCLDFASKVAGRISIIAWAALPVLLIKFLNNNTLVDNSKPLVLTDLVDEAEQNLLPPYFGNEVTLNKLIEILGKERKSNAMLVGPPGCGKTAIVQGLAAKIANGDVPDFLKGAKVFTLDIDALFAGTKYTGQSEKRFVELMNLLKNETKAILFIDEAHRMVSGKKNENTLGANLSERLKPFLTKKGFMCIAATTQKEFDEFIKPDGAITRRFSKLTLEEPSVEETKIILSNIKKKRFEEDYGITIPDDVIDLIATKCKSLEGNFPDKAIDVIERLCSSARLKKQPEITENMVDSFFKSIKVQEVSERDGANEMMYL